MSHDNLARSIDPIEKCKFCDRISGGTFNGAPICLKHLRIVESTQKLQEDTHPRVSTRTPVRKWIPKLVPLWERALAWFRIVEAYQAISFLAKGTTVTNSTATTTFVPAIPAGCTNLTTRMYAIGCVNADKTGSLNTPAGWTKLFAVFVTSGVTLFCYAKWFATGDSAPSISWTTTAKNTGAIFAYNGLDLTTPEDVTADSTGTATGSSGTATDVTKTFATMGGTRLHIIGKDGTAATTLDFRMVSRLHNATSTTSAACIDVGDEMGMASGALGTRASTFTSAHWVAATMLLRPATPDTIGLVQSAKNTVSGSSVTATFPATTTANNLITAEFTCSTVNTPTITSFSNPQARTDAGIQTVMQFYRANAPATTTVTATRGSGTDNNSLLVKEWKGIATSTPLDTQGANTSASGPITVTSGTTSSGRRLAIATFTHDGSGGTSTFDTNYITRWDQANTTISPEMSEDITFAGGSTKAATFQTSATANYAGQIMIFKVASTTNSLAGTIASSSAVSGVPLITHSLATDGVVAQSVISGVPKITHSLATPGIGGQSSVSGAIALKKNLPGTIAGQSSLSGALALQKNLSATIAGVSVVSGVPHITHSLSTAGITGLSTISGSINPAKNLFSTITSLSTITGAISLTKNLPGTIVGQSSIAGALKLSKNLFSTIIGTSIISGTLLTTHSLSSIMTGQSSIVGILTITNLLSGTVVSISVISGTITAIGTSGLAGTINGQSSVAGALSIIKNLSALSQAQSSISGSISLKKLLSGTLSDQSTIQGALSLIKNLSGSIVDLSTISGNLSISKNLTGTIISLSQINGSISPIKNLSGTIIGVSSISGALRLAKFLNSLITAQSVVTGILTIQGFNFLLGTISSQSSISGTLKTIHSLQGALSNQSSISGSLKISNLLRGTIIGLSNLQGNLALQKFLASTLNAQSLVSGTLHIIHSLSPNIIMGQSSISGEIRSSKLLRGNIQSSSILSGNLILTKNLFSILSAQSQLTGVPTVTKDLVALMAAISSIRGSLLVQIYSLPPAHTTIIGITNSGKVLVGGTDESTGIIGITDGSDLWIGKTSSPTGIIGITINKDTIIGD